MRGTFPLALPLAQPQTNPHAQNMDCPNGGWFHLGCLGMTNAPQGKWWCDSCRPGADDASGQKRKKRKFKY